MGALEEQARFLVTKYGTAAGPVGLPHTGSAEVGAPALMIIIGLLIFGGILFLLLRDFMRLSQARAVRRDYFQ